MIVKLFAATQYGYAPAGVIHKSMQQMLAANMVNKTFSQIINGFHWGIKVKIRN
jgi:hypothetical protein